MLIILGAVLLGGAIRLMYTEMFADEIADVEQIKRIIETSDMYHRHAYHNPVAFGKSGYRPTR